MTSRQTIRIAFLVLGVFAYSLVFSRGLLVRQVAALGDPTEWWVPAAKAVGVAPGTVLFRDSFERPNGLITNEFAYWNRGHADAVTSPTWRVTSGSFFARAGSGWTGVPDASIPDASSDSGTDSAVFRMTTRRLDFGNVAVSFVMRLNGFVQTRRTPRHGWDGVHIFLRYQDPSELYYASVSRRDGRAVIKKKCSRGTVNGGTYFALGHYVPTRFTLHRWQHITATVANGAGGSVAIAVYEDGRRVLARIDRGTGCAPITTPGAVGLRGDNANFQVEAFVVSSLR